MRHVIHVLLIVALFAPFAWYALFLASTHGADENLMRLPLGNQLALLTLMVLPALTLRRLSLFR